MPLTHAPCRRCLASLVLSAGPLAAALLAVAAAPGCSSQSSEIVIPEASEVPPPSSERGEAIDPSTYKRVKVE